MTVLIARDDQQLRRLEQSIASLKSRSPAEQSRLTSLIAALEREKATVLSFSRRAAMRHRFRGNGEEIEENQMSVPLHRHSS